MSKLTSVKSSFNSFGLFVDRLMSKERSIISIFLKDECGAINQMGNDAICFNTLVEYWLTDGVDILVEIDK